MAAPVRKVIVVGDGAKPRVADTAKLAVASLRELTEVAAIDLDESQRLETIDADLAFVFGGDGAILKAVRRLGRNPVPVCGVNLGKLGFLATLTDQDLAASLGAIVRGEYSITSAIMLDCSVVRAGSRIHASRAVNDAVISRGALSRLVPIDLLIDGELITTYNGDGILVATPLGSTAHCLSAGGPIIEPGVDAMILVPICPHTLSNRPLAVRADRQIAFEIKNGPPGVALTVDGQVFQELRTGDVISIGVSSERFRLVRALGHNYFKMLRNKLGWSGNLGG